MNRIAYRGKQISEFMGQNSHEFVFTLVGRLQRFFCSLVVVNVNAGTDPREYVPVLAQYRHPACLAVPVRLSALMPKSSVRAIAGFVLPASQHLRHYAVSVLWMNCLEPAEALLLLP